MELFDSSDDSNQSSSDENDLFSSIDASQGFNRLEDKDGPLLRVSVCRDKTVMYVCRHLVITIDPSVL